MNNIEEVKEIIENSGNNFHCRAMNYLKSKSWHTLVSPYYMDNATNKPREIDLVAEKAFPVSNMFGRLQGSINIKLFIECKYIPQENVFWLDDKDKEAAEEWIVANTPLRKDNTYTNKHHYICGDQKVAKLFSSKTKPKIENEVIYKALNQSLNAMVYNRRNGSIIPANPRYKDRILATVEYPVILCNSFDKFYRVDVHDQSDPQFIRDNFHLEVNYAYIDNNNHRNEFFLIDVVAFEKLDSFLESIDADAAAMIEMVRED